MAQLPPVPVRRTAIITTAAILSLILGLAVGIAARGSTAAWAVTLDRWLAPIGSLWVRVLNLLVLPLIVSLAVLSALQTPGMGRIGRKAIAVFAAMLASAAALTLLIGPPLVSLLPADPATAAALRSGITVPPAAHAAAQAHAGIGSWLRDSLPRSFDALFRGIPILLILLAAVLLALLLRHLAKDRLPGVERGFQSLAKLTELLVRVILLLTPLGVLALSFRLGRNAGGVAAGFLVTYMVLVAGVLLLFTAALYPVTAWLGKTSLARFARAAAPAQLVAVSTQSSLASLPALVEGGRTQLGLSPAATGFVLPLAVALFKLNRTISGPFQLLLLTHAFGVPLALGSLLLFVAASFLQSFLTPGIPGAGTPYFTLPLYVAAGAPIEGVVLIATADPLLDPFKTLTNVTADLSAATLLSRA